METSSQMVARAGRRQELTCGRSGSTWGPLQIHVTRRVRETMSRVGAPRQDPIPIGEIAEPPFARLPDPTTLFQARAGRFRNLSEGHPLAAYLRFLAALSDAQHQLQDGLAVPDLPAPDVRARAKEFGMPPLDRGAFSADATFETTLQRLFSLAREIDMPEPARAALARATGADMATRGGMLRAVLADAVPVEGLADHLFIVAALHVHFARQASRLEAKTSRSSWRGCLSRLWRTAGGLDGGGVDRCAQYAVLRLLIVQHPLERAPHQMHALRLADGDQLSASCRRRYAGAGGNLRTLVTAM